jgi:DNA ligase-1
MFQHLANVVGQLQKDSSVLNKIQILSENLGLRKYFKYTYDPFLQFYVTSDNCLKMKNSLTLDTFVHSDLFDLLDDLHSRKFTGHAAIIKILSFIEQHKNYESLIYCILDKDLKCRVNESIINKVWKDLIPSFDTALGYEFDIDNPPNFKNEKWLSSRKLDGVRCILIIENGVVSTFSRQGLPFTTLANLENLFKGMGDGVFDGELCMVDANGNEDFQSVMKEIRKKNHNITNFKYLVFDHLTLEEFRTKTSTRTFSERLNCLKKNIDFSWNPRISLVEQTPVMSLEQIIEELDDANKRGWEGLILRKDAPYKGKRSKDILKVKSFSDQEFVVNKVVSGPFRYVEASAEREEVMLSAIEVTYKGNTVSVGSGFTIAERKRFHQNPEDIVGKIVTVKYFRESVNQDGGLSLRFPTVKCLHGDGRSV